jgi:hypothetical protein
LRKKCLNSIKDKNDMHGENDPVSNRQTI